MVTAEIRGNYFICLGTPSDIELLRGIPHRAYNDKVQAWTAPRTQMVAEYLFGINAALSPDAITEVRRLRAGEPRFPLRGMELFPKTTPLEHQSAALARMLSMRNYALFHDPGLGKSKALIDDSAQAFSDKVIQAVAIVCPNSIKSNWVDEFEKHCPLPVECWVYSPENRTKTLLWIKQAPQEGVLKVLIIACESISHKSGQDVLEAFLTKQATSLGVDESSRFKTHNATRTKALLRLSPLAKRRRILTGTAITKGLQDAWSQFAILSPDILAGMNFFTFRNKFCVMGGFEAKQIVSSKNEDQFVDLISDFVHMATKDKCLDLPPKVYQTRRVAPSDEMLRLYNDLRTSGAAIVAPGQVVTYTIAVVRDLRLQQITGGFATADRELASVLGHQDEGMPEFCFEDPVAWEAAVAQLEQRLEKAQAEPISGPNPKVEEVLQIAEDCPGKIIIWCRFRPEIEAVRAALEKVYPGSVVEFHGGIDNETRTLARKRFQEDPRCRFFVGQQESGGIGITLTAAETMVYFSNSWSLETRIQSEDRAHRVGQTKTVVYIDLLMEMPAKGKEWVDSKVFRALKARRDYVATLNDEIEEATR
jgi:SNF2 family DNA or RNA helicase